MKTFGQKLKEARKSKDLTQRQLADMIGAKHNSISNWENDQNKPDPDTIELICGILDIEPNYLFSKEKNTNDDRVDDSNLSKAEQEMIHKYRFIDNKGKHTVDTVLEMEYNRCNKPYLLPNAAHEIEGASEQDKQRDEELLRNFSRRTKV